MRPAPDWVTPSASPSRVNQSSLRWDIMPNFISEDDIEQALLALLRDEYGYALLNCFTADPDDLNDGSGRADKRNVIFPARLHQAACRLNPDIPETAVTTALEDVTRNRRAMSLAAANQELDGMIRNGIPVEYDNEAGRKENGRVRLIDFNTPANNDFLAVSQLWVKGTIGYRRPDVLLYVNGLPLIFIELKNSVKKLKNAYDDNLTTYKEEIGQLFHATAVCILSNGIESKIGSITAGWEHFFNWLRVDDETEKIDRQQIQATATSLERIAHSLCRPARLLDYIENFIIFYNDSQKIIAQNHQFIGVNKAIDRFSQRQEADEGEKGKLGVFWHTQGSGKSFSMIFYANKIWRKMAGNYTFLIVTDRKDLDGQIYRNFLNTGVVGKKEAVRPKNRADLRAFLGQNKRIIFTLIHKFGYDKGKAYPILSDRNDIIVIVDEAHRTQYKTLAENMRAGLPNARYLAFTGTPLLGKTRKTNAWFGDYVSEYNFTQSMDDGATVPLFYEKRVPEVLIQNDNLSDEFYAILEDENLDEVQQAKLEKKFARETEVIVRDDRLEIIAQDVVAHFPRRGYLGKGLFVCVDKFTAVNMYDKVQYHWKQELKRLHREIKTAVSPQKEALQQTLDFMRSTKMTVVISEEAGEVEKFAAKGLNIAPHRARLNSVDENGRDVEAQFKDPDDPLRLVFVCAMWLTGFDAPTLSTLYLDKPMKGHTLMQTIARANRVTPHLINDVPKRNGEIIDYYNVFRNMKQALAAYAVGSDGEEQLPVREKSALFALLDDALAQGIAFCHSKGIDLESVQQSGELFKNLSQFKTYADILLSKDGWRKEFFVYENTITALYEACKPEIVQKRHWRSLLPVFQYLRGVLDAIIQRQDIDSISLRIAALLDESVIAADDALHEPQPEYMIQAGKVWDLSVVDVEQLKAEFKQRPYKHIEIADLRAFIEEKLAIMLQENGSRADFAQRLQQIVERYNAGGMATENYFAELLNFNQALSVEEDRHIRMGLTEAELRLFDLIKKEKMTKGEETAVKNAAKALLKRLREEKPAVIVQDWYRDVSSQERVRAAVENVLNEMLPETYDRTLFMATRDRVYENIYERAYRGLPLAV